MHTLPQAKPRRGSISNCQQLIKEKLLYSSEVSLGILTGPMPISTWSTRNKLSGIIQRFLPLNIAADGHFYSYRSFSHI